MTGVDARGPTLVELLDERRYLLDMVTGTPGWAAHAELVVRLTYRRWFALAPHDRARIGDPRNWLARVAGRICSDVTGSAAPVGAQPPIVTDDGPAAEDAHDAVVHAFAAGCCAGDGAALHALLAESVTSVADTGGGLRLDPAPVRGAVRVNGFLRGLFASQPELAMTERWVNGAVGLAVCRRAEVVAVLALDVRRRRVHHVWIVLNPDKLRGWNRLRVNV